MERITTAAPRSLRWLRTPDHPHVYELRAGQDPIAVLDWPRGARATAHAATGAWTFDRPGFFRRRVIVQSRAPNPAGPAGTVDPGWTGGGIFHTPSGERFRWGPENVWRSCWGWRTPEGVPLLRLGCHRGEPGVPGAVDLEAAALTSPDLPLLLPLGWYLYLLSQRDDSTTASVLGSTAGS